MADKIPSKGRKQQGQYRPSPQITQLAGKIEKNNNSKTKGAMRVLLNPSK